MTLPQADRPDPEREVRASLGSIPVGQLGQHFVVFGISAPLLLAARVYNAVVEGAADPTWHLIFDLIGDKGGSTMATCLGLSAIIVEGGNMVFAELSKMRRQRKSFNDGQREMDRRWQEWLARKEAAEAQGETFDEPPPTPQNGQRKES